MNNKLKYAYYPGCSAHSTARDMHESSTAVARVLGIELEEVKGWSCCGASAAHQTNRLLGVSLPAANLLLARDMGFDMVVNCAACYNRMKMANHEVASSTQIRDQVGEIIGQVYGGSVPVRHFVEILIEDFGIERLRKSLKKTLNGLKVASYYGCFLVRPHNVTQFDDPENPVFLDNIVTALGGESIDWPHKVECCGGGLNLTRTDIVVKLSSAIADLALKSGANCITVACPMCQASLDLRQKDIERETGKHYNLPVLYFTQLIGLCLDIPKKELGLNRLMVEPTELVQRINSSSDQIKSLTGANR